MDSLSNDIQTRGLYAFISLNFHFLSSLTGSIIVERTLEQHKYISVCYSVTEPVCLNASLCLLSFNELVHPLMLSVCFDAITFFFGVV